MDHWIKCSDRPPEEDGEYLVEVNGLNPKPLSDFEEEFPHIWEQPELGPHD